MDTDEIQKIIYNEFPGYPLLVENCNFKSSKLILELVHSHLRYGGTVSGQTIILLADMSI